MVFLLHTYPFDKLQQALTKIETPVCINNGPVVFRNEGLG
jgi:hypothetical protein